MNCDYVRKFINDDKVDLKAISDHLRTCDKCREEYGADIDLELALRELSLEAGTVDITRDIQALISTAKSSKSKYVLRKRLVWIAAGVISILLLFAGWPNLISWGKELVSRADSLLPAVKNLNIGEWESRLQAFKTVENVKMAMAVAGAVLLALLTYLWRELKQIVR